MEERDQKCLTANEVVEFFETPIDTKIVMGAEFDTTPHYHGSKKICISIIPDYDEVYILPLFDSEKPEEVCMTISEFRENFINFSFTLDNYYSK